MYKLVKSIFPGAEVSTVKRLNDNAFIPFDPQNRDYAEYLEWLAEGNAPIGADEPLPADQPE